LNHLKKYKSINQKIMKKILIFAFTLFCVISYAQKTTFKEVKGNGNFIVQVPDYMSNDTSLNKDAAISYSNPKEEMYLIVITDSKKALKDAGINYTVDSYFAFASKNIESMVTSSNVTEPKKSKINGNAALVSIITGKFGELGVYYKLGIVESKEHFYQVLTWTLDSYKTKFDKDMDKMINSLKEL